MAIVLRPHGKLNAHGSSKLKRKLSHLIESNTIIPHTWIVDLWDVSAIDRNGLVALIELRRKAQNAQCQLILRDLSESVQATLDIAHLSEEFEIQYTEGRPRRRSQRTSRRRPISNPPQVPTADASNLSDISDIPQTRTAKPQSFFPAPVPPPRTMALDMGTHERKWTPGRS